MHVHTARGDILIGADGIHSKVRETLFPEEGPPCWNGLMLWRGARRLAGVPHRTVDDHRGRIERQGRGLSDRGRIEPGDRLTNWAVLVKVGDGSAPPPRREDWSRLGNRDELMPHVAGFSIPQVDFAGLVRATPEFWEYPCCDRDPLPYWTAAASRCSATPRIRCIRSAPMAPRRRSSMRDAWPTALARSEHPRQALVAYEKQRLPMTADIVASNRRGGPEGVIDAVEQLAPQGFSDIDSVLNYEAARGDRARLAAKAGFAARVVARS